MENKRYLEPSLSLSDRPEVRGKADTDGGAYLLPLNPPLLTHDVSPSRRFGRMGSDGHEWLIERGRWLLTVLTLFETKWVLYATGPVGPLHSALKVNYLQLGR